MDKRRIALVVGGSGLIGNFLVRDLSLNAAYREVRILGRTESDITHKKITFYPSQLIADEFPRSAFAGVDDIFCAVGTTQKKTPDKKEYYEIDCGIPSRIAELGRIFKAEKFLVVSSIGASVESRFFYLRTKGEMEEKVIQSGVPVIEIFRPSTLLGKRKEFRLGEGISKFLDPFTRYFVPKKYAGIHAHCVSKAMIIRALDETEPSINVWESYQIKELCKI
ncbi:MAG: NAD-dependent epimerase/dehydratase family protein [Cryomorphaceae bacterium]|nr:NAD-dependent epimerase/dehydratase family protein [Cryomorphaceae bacterium]